MTEAAPTAPDPTGPALRPPGRLNLVIGGAIIATGTLLQVLAAGQSSRAGILALGVLFSFLYLPLYSLLHEAEHRVFHARGRLNDAAGVVLAVFFPGSFTFLRACHLGHHRRNRSDAEMFDLYYPTDRLWCKRAYFYFLYLGGFWLAVPLATLALVVWPRLLRSSLVQDAPSAAAMVNGLPPGYLHRIRGECAAVLLVHVSIFVALGRPISYLVLYGLYGLNWSAQQYVTHAASPRHVLDGAHNLRAHWLYEKLLLHFNWHLAHHQHPRVPWTELPAHDDPTRVRPGYLGAFVRFWRGPQPCSEPAPARRDA